VRWRDVSMVLSAKSGLLTAALRMDAALSLSPVNSDHVGKSIF
jgi:hypothetical protein